MRKSLICRIFGIGLTLALALSMLPANALAAQADGLCQHHSAHTDDCGYAESGECLHVCTSENGCITVKCAHQHVATCFDAQGNSLCRHACTENEACYTPITDCLHKDHTDCGYAEGGECDFAVNGCDECEKENALTQILGTDVTIEGYTFPHTGEEIRPAVTVTVGGTRLTEGTHYSLAYDNNIAPGEASVTVTGLEEGGYRGLVVIPFTITEQPKEEAPEESKPHETQPEPTQPEATEPEEETKPVDYKITTGSGKTWYQGSDRNLLFVVNGESEDITGISVDGKKLGKSDYTIGKNGLVTLKASYLKKLTVDKYELTIHFADGEAEGTFNVSDELDTTNPATGDTIGIWLTIMGISLTGLSAAWFTRKRAQC